MAKKDFYEVLGVSKDCDEAAIKRAYREAAKKCHPDLGGDAEKLKEVNEAYECLKDPQKRAAYDRMGHAAFDGMGGMGGAGSGFHDFNFHTSFDMGGFEDILSDVFGAFTGQTRGRPRSRSGGQRGSDLQYRVGITLEDAFTGTKKRVSFKTLETCEQCKGTGSLSGKKTTCSTCHGSGTIRSGKGFFVMEQLCPTCRGTGQEITDPCPRCKGTGAYQTTKTLDVNIPKGAASGTRLRVKGEGEAGQFGGETGDLYIVVEVATHKTFERQGNDLIISLSLDMPTAALGAQLDIAGIDGGTYKLTVPEGTQPNTVLKMKNLGMPVLNHPTARGDMYVRANLITPTRLSKKQKELLKEFQAAK